ncbi:ATP synthase subunit f [Homalodisca vitripennis]|nr:ATP synthase subunit f [Homalodisca vitripennis]KAG8303177.1 ATP synthase subunit f [Homalodisca vitripennis]
MAFGDYPADYNPKVHGPYDPARYYGKADTPLAQVKLGEFGQWLMRRNKSPQAMVACGSRVEYYSALLLAVARSSSEFLRHVSTEATCRRHVACGTVACSTVYFKSGNTLRHVACGTDAYCLLRCVPGRMPHCATKIQCVARCCHYPGRGG